MSGEEALFGGEGSWLSEPLCRGVEVPLVSDVDSAVNLAAWACCFFRNFARIPAGNLSISESLGVHW
jgi:hypothetical protein